MFDTYNNQEVAKRVVHILRIVATQIEEHPELLTNAEFRIDDVPARKKKVAPPLVDFEIFEVFAAGGESALRSKLEHLDIKTLKIIIANNRFDPSKLAEKWRKKDRLVNLILERVTARSEKGQVFKEYP
ncbi:MAG: hypothetical protein ABFS56_02965 [Pseudomonadota bacterium]